MQKDWIGLEHLPRLLGLLLVIAAFVVVNVVLWYGQDLVHSSEKKELDQLQGKLSSLRSAADALEAELDKDSALIDGLRQSLDNCEARVASIESIAVGGTLPARAYDEYQHTLSTCNENVEALNARVDSYNSVLASYEQSVDSYNELVPRVNTLAKVVGTKYLVVPVSVGRGRHSVADR